MEKVGIGLDQTVNSLNLGGRWIKVPLGNFYAVLSCLGTPAYGQLGWRDFADSRIMAWPVPYFPTLYHSFVFHLESENIQFAPNNLSPCLPCYLSQTLHH